MQAQQALLLCEFLGSEGWLLSREEEQGAQPHNKACINSGAHWTRCAVSWPGRKVTYQKRKKCVIVSWPKEPSSFMAATQEHKGRVKDHAGRSGDGSGMSRGGGRRMQGGVLESGKLWYRFTCWRWAHVKHTCDAAGETLALWKWELHVLPCLPLCNSKKSLLSEASLCLQLGKKQSYACSFPFYRRMGVKSSLPLKLRITELMINISNSTLRKCKT